MNAYRTLLLFLFLAFGLQAQVNLQAPLPLDASVRIGMLPNGMRYYIRQNAKPEKRAELRLVVHAGSLQEDPDQLGIAHFVEHMAFNGTKNFPKNELVDYLESTGTRFGADLNAYTSFEETVYEIQARTDSLALLEKGLLVLQDWASAIAFDSIEIDKERGVVVSEWRSRLSPDQRMQQEYFPVLYKNSRYAERLPIGKPEIIEKVNYDAIRRFYKDWYRPELMAIVAVGDFDVKWMEMQLIQRFCKIPKTENARKREDYQIPRHQETLFAICSDPEASFTIAQLIYKLPEQPLKTLGNYKAQLARSLYNRMLGARLFELQQQPNPPFTFASSGYGSDIGDMDSYLVHVFTAEGKSIEGLRSILLETRRAQLHGFTATELERQKLEILKSAESAYRERDKMQSAALASRFVYHYLNESPALDAEQYWKLCQALLPLIKLEDINPLPKQWLGKENRVFVVTAPQKEGVPLPTEAALKALLDEIDRATPPPFVDNVSDEPLLAADFTSVEIIEQTEYQELGLTELKLANGVKVVLKPTDFKNDEISLSAFSPGGHSLYEDKDYMNATNAAQMVDFSGIGKLDAVALQKKLTGKQLSISPYIGELEEGFSGYASPEDFETLLQLIYLYFTEPRRDSVVMQSLITRQRSVYQNMMQNPYYYFNEERGKIKYNGHSRRLMTKAEDLDNITLDGVYRIFRERFSDASDFTFVLVGNIDIEKIKPLLTKYLGNLPSIQRKETWRDINADLTSGRIDTTIVRGQAPKAIVELTWHGAFDFNNRNARYHFSSMLELLRIKLRESLREEQGGVYGVRVSGAPSKIPKEDYFITISFQCEPEQTDSLIQAAYAEIQKVQSDGAAEKDLQKIRETQKQSRLKSLKENGFWSGQIALRYQYGLPLDGILYEEYEKIVDQLDSQSIKNAANLYFKNTNFMKIVLLPEK